MAGREVPVLWRGRTVRAWVPEPLSGRDVTAVSVATARAVERALGLLIRVDDSTPTEWEPLARLLLRGEGIASSFIEGLRAPTVDIAAARLVPSADPTSAWVADNLAVLDDALDHARTDEPLDVEVLHAWHRSLMRSSAGLPERMIGAWRDEQGWIGGTSPLDAALVTPPPVAVAELMADLVEFTRRADLDAVTMAAICHAQFEVVHPYADGNGRIGRVLLLWVLVRRLGVRVVPPISMSIAADRGGYLAGLTQFRLGDADAWVRWVAETVSGAATQSVRLSERVEGLLAEWRQRLDDTNIRSDAAARRIVPILVGQPVLTAGWAASEVGVTVRAARTAMATLHAAGIVDRWARVPVGPGRAEHWWVATEIAALAAV